MTALDTQLSPRELGARRLAGYRVLRSLARDEHAEVLLGHRNVPSDSDGSAPGAVQTVAMKVSPASDDAYAAALRECAALERARGDHIVDLLDVDADEESIRLIFERLPRGDLAELLRIRGSLDAGEAVTILAPIAVTLLRLHAAGIAHGNLDAGTVLFRDDGSPTLIGFSRAELFEPGAPEVVLEQVDAVRRDRHAVRALAMTVLGRVVGGQARTARELHDDVAGCGDELILPLLTSRLFEVAAAVPVRFGSDDPQPEAAAVPRAVPVAAPVVESSFGTVGGTTPKVAAILARVLPEAMLQRLLVSVERSPLTPIASGARGALGRRWHSWTPARRRIVVAVGAGALTVGIVTAIVPARPSATGAPAANLSGSTASPSQTPDSSSPAGEAESGAIDPAVVGDDPIAAAGALVAARDRCLGSLSLRCLERVDEAGSGAFGDDQAAIRAAQQGGELPDPLEGAADGAPVLIERLGDSALVRLGQASSAASILLVKAEDGWRIRDLIAARPPTG